MLASQRFAPAARFRGDPIPGLFDDRTDARPAVGRAYAA
jgi:hypothetical protein